MKKLMSLVLACAMVVTMLVGCGKKDDGNKDGNTGSQSKVPDYMNATEYPVVKQPITVKVMGAKGADSDEWKDMELFKRMEQLTGIHMEFDTPVGGAGYTEKKNLALASGEVPDVFYNGGISTKDEETYGPQGLFLPLEGYIDQYAPYLKKMFDKYPDAKSAATATDGHIYSLPSVVKTLTTAANIIYINMDWLKQVNMSKPATTDEFYNVLKAWKDKDVNGNGKPDEVGLSYWKQADGISSLVYNVFIAAFTGQAGGANFDVTKDGKVIYNPIEPNFKSFLEYMNKLYKDGLLDPEMFSQSMQQYVAKYKAGTMGVSTITLSQIIDPKATYNYELLQPLTSPTNKKQVCVDQPGISTGSIVITNKCKYPEAMMRWADVLYREDSDAIQGLSGLTTFLGVYGDTWTYSDSSKKTYLRSSKDPQLNAVQYINKSVSPAAIGNVVTMAYPDKSMDPLLLTKATESEKNYFPFMVPAYPGTIRYAGEANDRVALLQNDLNTYVGQQIAKFITGEEPISKWDSYVSNVKTTLKFDELLKLKQDAYDKWKSAQSK